MRFMMLLKADRRTEAGVLPTAGELEEMGRYNDALVQAGVLVDAAGLKPSAGGARLTFRNGQVQVTDGPFAETKELLAGYWTIEVASKEEAIEWARRAPFHLLPSDGRSAEIELRQVYELADFPEVPERVAQLDAALRSRAVQEK